MTAFDLDPGVRAQDDLFRHVNGPWLASTAIPDDKPSYGTTTVLRDAAEDAVRDIVTGLTGAEPGTDAAKVQDLFSSFMDTETVERRGLAPLAPLLAEIDAIDDLPALLDYFGRSVRRRTGSPLDVDVDSDPGDPTRYALFVGQSGLGLPDEEYYRDERFADVLARYREHVATTLELAGLDATGAGSVVELETEIAARHWDKVRTRDLVQMYNPVAPSSFARTVDWLRMFTAAGVGPIDQLIDAQPSFAVELADLLGAERLPAWRAWARFHLISALSPYLPEQFVAARFAFYGTVLHGIPTNRERWRRGIALVERCLGEAVGRLYVERHFSPVAKQRMDELVANLVEAYRISISELDWMTETTRAQALDKLSKFIPKIGYPDRWRDYTALEIRADDLLGNVLRSAEFEAAYELAKLGGPIDRHEWLMTPQTVNAYYHPLRNEIVFPAAILQPPFFTADADEAVNYGAIGAVIGHEIGHGFDDQGATCDGDGKLRDWWTPEDKAAFEERTRALVEQYNTLSPAETPGHDVNGELTLGENIGDLGGLAIAYQAWRLAIGDEEPEPIDGLSGAQRLFFAWARAWQQKIRPEALITQLTNDPHAPDEFRCNQVVRNLPEFYDAFGVTGDDELWLPPEERVKIW
ncbi:M13 family metallopeptidase [Micropruina sonneratiae]|uniref:M13 family metallopeptidase n=1 Tax=Micropruina sonneratiae TaxID=2986940 RepID=UPI00222696AB|nr:M13-type metalloendopeptidase [Micropruina sp. KQZ13P-5]MCW3158107.1 peptidase M13 [Micropruina sp. KQZ13P-5]